MVNEAVTAAKSASTGTQDALAVLMRPMYVDRIPPCNQACPAGENIQEWLQLAQAARFEQAWQALVKNNPMPAIHGRVCYHPCENGCNRKHLDQPVSIHAVERFLGDLAISKGWKFPLASPTGKRVLVVGSGPCGLSAAYHLARMGHAVTVREAGAKTGGMMRYGIPEYRLPRNILDAEIARIADMGVDFQTNSKIDDLEPYLRGAAFDAIFLAIGAQVGKRVDIPAADAARIVDALQFLADPDSSSPLCLGKRVAIYGGGNTAMDAARTALRLGAEESLIVYRRDQARMPAHKSELEEAVAEGVVVNWLRTIKTVGEHELEVEVMQLDSKGMPQPTGKTEILNADTLILALGQETQSDFLRNVPGIVVTRDGAIQVDDHLMTGCAGIFAGGDMIPLNKTVTTAVGHGKKAARYIDAYINRGVYTPLPKHQIARFDLLRIDWYPKGPRAEQPVAPSESRIESFEETIGGLDKVAAVYEARRCFSCGNCFECDTCCNVCPEQTIEKLGPGKRFTIHMENCSRCGLCVQECPCGAMTMTPEIPPPVAEKGFAK
ncbi:MAG TPA: NAD(P)-binding protein [Phycisphaerae bacterium]|nr:NAD(P)-binding protein [Phycisphaerae bacterium]